MKYSSFPKQAVTLAGQVICVTCALLLKAVVSWDTSHIVIISCDVIANHTL